MLFFVTKFTQRASRQYFSAMLLGNESAYFLPQEVWELWIPSWQTEPVTCRSRVDTFIGSGVGAEGQHLTVVGDDEITDSFETGTTHSEPNAVRLSGGGVKGEPPTPFFLSESPDAKPVKCQARLRLRFDRLLQLPDFQAQLANLRQMDAIGAKYDLEFPERVMDVPFASLASIGEAHANIPPQTGMWFPFEKESVYGVMQLGNSLGTGEFQATLHFADDIGSLAPGTVLSRRVEWEEDGEAKTMESEIATIVESTIVQSNR